jgi:uncharacterized protein YndB with AHSA1/START domain
MTVVGPATDIPVRKTVTVKATPERAFAMFTEGFDTWWPKSHHIGKAPLDRSVIEGRVGGRCYGRCVDGTDCPWGTILAWDPPHAFVMAWQITTNWTYEPDLEKSSEVEVTFTPVGNGATRVDLEHRRFDRYGAAGDTMRKGVDSEGGWASLLALFAAAAESSED